MKFHGNVIKTYLFIFIVINFENISEINDTLTYTKYVKIYS